MFRACGGKSIERWGLEEEIVPAMAAVPGTAGDILAAFVAFTPSWS
jgi:hypothetical protein